MLRIQSNIPLGVPNLGTPFKCNPFIVPALIGAGASLISGLFGNSQQSVYTKEQQRLQSRLNREEMNHSMALQKGQQEWMMNTQYGKMVSGMKNAGLNPAMAGGGSVGAASGGSAHPTTGGVGPGAHGEALSSAVAQGAQFGIQLKQGEQELKTGKAQEELLKAQRDKVIAEKNKVNQNFQIDAYKTDPRIQELFKQGVEADVLNTYAEADVNKARVAEIMVNANKLFNEIGLVQDMRNEAQARTAETYVKIKSLFVGMDEAQSRMAVNYADAYLKREQVNTEKAKQSDLYASAEHHLASAGAEGARGNLTVAQQKGQELANYINQYRQEIQELSGSKSEQGSLIGAKRLLDLLNPLAHVSFVGSSN